MLEKLSDDDIKITLDSLILSDEGERKLSILTYLFMIWENDTFLETFFDKRSDKVDYGTSGIAEWGSF